VAWGFTCWIRSIEAVAAELHQQVYRYGASYAEVVAVLKSCMAKSPHQEAALVAALLGTHDEHLGPAPDFADALAEATPVLEDAWHRFLGRSAINGTFNIVRKSFHDALFPRARCLST
jgi:hypothetical protein